MLNRLKEGISFCIVAVLGENIIGVIEVRNVNHIALLFVDDQYHKNGIAKNLVSLAIERAKISEIYVHSSTYAVNIYAKMGFNQLDNEQVKNGIRYTPMKKSIFK
jgi:N-acetylglutamate synthase-like GNAT family acetyltransferase